MNKIIFNESNIPSLNDTNIVITGGNSGIGYQTALMLVRKDADVIIASRDIKKSEEAVKTILKDYPNGKIKAYPLDLGDRASIETFSDLMAKEVPVIDILINNSGVMYTPFQKTKDGFEFQNGVNFLGHYILTKKLLPLIKKSTSPRIVSVSSIAHKYGKIDFNNFLFEKKNSYSKVKSYHQSKLANLMFSIGLSERLKGITVHAAHPGVAITNLMRYMTDDKRMKNSYRFIKKISHSAYDGALPTVLATVTNDFDSHTYFGPKSAFETKGKPGIARVSRRAKNVKLIHRLFDLAESLTGVSYKA